MGHAFGGTVFRGGTPCIKKGDRLGDDPSYIPLASNGTNIPLDAIDLGLFWGFGPRWRRYFLWGVDVNMAPGVQCAKVFFMADVDPP